MKKIFSIIFVVAVFLTSRPVFATGPMLKFSPSTGTYKNGETFKINIGVDSGTEKAQGVDVWVTFDASKVEVDSIDPLVNDTFQFSMEKFIHNDTGKFEVWFTAATSGSYEGTVVTGDLATVTFRPKATGTVNVNFTCNEGSLIDSNIIRAETGDIINCASNINGVYTITDGGTANPDPTAVPTASPNNPTAAPTSTNNELPKTGTVETTIGLIIFGVVSLLSSLALKFL